MTTGKTINLFLIDGDANGRIKCTLANWTGVTYKIPRTMLEQAKSIHLLNQTGVYFLFGSSDETGDPLVYVGQAGIRKNGQGNLCRLDEHRRNDKKDYWTEAVAFTTSNNSFGPTEISYLENRFCNMAVEAKRYLVKNGNDPNHGNITEEKESELEEFIVYDKLVMGALGYKVFEPLLAAKSSAEAQAVALDDEPLLYFRTNKAEATGKRTAEGFVVLAGSKVALEFTKSCPEITRKNRNRNAGKISPDGTLETDILFSSPSAAASFVSGSSLNGNLAWKTANGLPLKELDARE